MEEFIHTRSEDFQNIDGKVIGKSFYFILFFYHFLNGEYHKFDLSGADDVVDFRSVLFTTTAVVFGQKGQEKG